MYKKHRTILFVFSILSGMICCLLGLRIVSIASDVISVVSISSALYLAAYAGIQASTELREKLKEPDEILRHRTQRYVLNSYFKVALILNVVTIISVCASSMVADRIVQIEPQLSSHFIKCLVEHFKNNNTRPHSLPLVWHWADIILNFSSITLFVANLIQMTFIGKFVVNRIPFDK